MEEQYKTDYELVKEKNYYSIWCRYEPLVRIYYKKLITNKIFAFDGFTDFYQSCYEVIVNAVDSVKLERIKKPQTWKIWIQINFYLKNYTTRKVVKEYFDENALSFDETFEGSYEDLDNLPYKEFMKSLSQNEKEIVDSRLNGETWGDLYKKYGRKFIDELRSSIIDKYTKYLGD